MRAHKSLKLLTNSLEHTKSVILRQSPEEVLHNVAVTAGAQKLLQLRHDRLLVADGQGRGAQDGGQFAVGFEGVVEALEGCGGLVEGGGFDGGRVLFFDSC